jgi:hypothetical protein
MDPRERKDVLGQWGVRDANPREVEEGKRIAADLAGSPLLGRPLEHRVASPFRPSVESTVLALGGPLPYMTRLREIERRTEAHEQALADAWRALAAACGSDAQAFARAWSGHCRRVDTFEVNDLIDRHNRWYPVEARLPMDPRRRDYVLVNGESYRRRHLDPAWALERFPPDLRLAALAAEPAA